MLNIAREHNNVKSVATRDGKIIAWMKDRPDRAVSMDTPDDLFKIGVTFPDWKRLKLDHLICTQEQPRTGEQRDRKQNTSTRVVRKPFSILVINVCGLKGKLLSMEFRSECMKYDLYLNETRYDDVDMNLI